MGRKMIHSARVTMVFAVALGLSGSGVQPVGATTPFTVCYDRATRLMHFSTLGRCYSPLQITLVVGGAPTGPRGARGLPGVGGLQGDGGLIGPSGIQGPQGAQGPPGATGPIGGTGPAGANSFSTHSVTDASALTDASMTVSCGPGSVVISGGYAASATRILASKPTSTRDGWTVSWNGLDPGTGVTVYAICVVGTNSPA